MTDHVAFAVDAAYLPWCAAAIRSVLDHAPGPLTVHLLHAYDVPGPEVDRLAAMVGSTGSTLVEHPVEPDRVAGLPSVDRFGPVVWLRVLLPDLLPDVDRVLYLDADTLAVAPLGDLLGADLGGCPVGAVPNVVEPSMRGHVLALGLDPDRFLNSGVLLLDLAALRADRWSVDRVRQAAAGAPSLAWPDQDVLNLLLAGRWQPLDARWNTMHAHAGSVADPAVVHFEGPSLNKPWHALCDSLWRGAWRSALDRTPWAGAPLEDDGVLTRVLARLPRRARVEAYVRVRRRTAPPPAAATPAPSDGHRRQPPIEASMSLADRAVVDEVRPYTMVSTERLLATMDAVAHVVGAGVPGAVVECGVWRGGNVLAMVRVLQRLGVDDRDVWLYDTFEGMTAPSAADTSAFDEPAAATWRRASAAGARAWQWLFPTDVDALADVRSRLDASGYPPERIHYVVGPVEDTLPAQRPDAVAVLRLDTDWYESTRHELEHLWPVLSPGGVLLVDDYGHWDGARRAVDEYLGALPGGPPLLARTDYAGRLAVKRF